MTLSGSLPVLSEDYQVISSNLNSQICEETPGREEKVCCRTNEDELVSLFLFLNSIRLQQFSELNNDSGLFYYWVISDEDQQGLPRWQVVSQEKLPLDGTPRFHLLAIFVTKLFIKKNVSKHNSSRNVCKWNVSVFDSNEFCGGVVVDSRSSKVLKEVEILYIWRCKILYRFVLTARHCIIREGFKMTTLSQLLNGKSLLNSWWDIFKSFPKRCPCYYQRRDWSECKDTCLVKLR